MKIDELLEKHDIDSIQKTTRITKENLKKMISKDFENLNKVQAFGFLSILEREYGAVEDLREDWEEYFHTIEENEKLVLPVRQDNSFLTGMKIDKETNPKLVLAGIGLLILVFVAFMAYDSDTKEIKVPPVPKVVTDLTDTNEVIDENHTQVAETNTTSLQNEQNITSSTLQIIPVKKLWFGIVDIASQVKNDQIIDKPFDINLTKPIVIVTSKATFSLQNQNSKKDYRDYRKHYFKVENGTLSEITRDQFVLLGGPKTW
ncbi:MAG: hypothetical protein PHI79_04060 [Sulfurovaceae bacterium]|nr:hypothetical protein [Sulfurovaceae bacterium]MDD5548758.1 hypothetical protein [Sulfurovaceae bacterium]